MQIKVDADHVEDVVKRMFWLGWQACGGPLGLGFLQNTPGADEGQVWDNVASHGDYPGTIGALSDDDGKKSVKGDYVFGRMMKLSVSWSPDGTIVVSDNAPRADYQAWCREYETCEALCNAAIESLDLQAVS